jgi:hypothetical protein
MMELTWFLIGWIVALSWALLMLFHCRPVQRRWLRVLTERLPDSTNWTASLKLSPPSLETRKEKHRDA